MKSLRRWFALWQTQVAEDTVGAYSYCSSSDNRQSSHGSGGMFAKAVRARWDNSFARSRHGTARRTCGRT